MTESAATPERPAGEGGSGLRRLVLGRVILFVGVSLVAAGVLALRLWDGPIYIGGSQLVRSLSAWFLQFRLPPITPWALAVVAAGFGCGAVGARLISNDRRQHPGEPLAALLNPSIPMLVLTVFASFLAVGLFAAADAQAWSSSRVVAPWLALVVVVATGLLLSDHRLGTLLKPVLGRWEILCLFAAPAAAFAIFAAISCSWRFSFIGDEYAFFDYARGMINDGLLSFDWLDGMGVYNDNPKTMSVYQAVWMMVFGPTCFAFRSSATFLTVICLPPLYLSLRNLVARCGGPARSAAVVGCIAFFSSEQIIVWAVQGKIHIAALPSLVFGLCLVLAARARASAFFYWLAGAVCGSAFYLSLLGVAVSVPCIGLLIGIDILRRMIRERRLSFRAFVPGLIFVAGLTILAAPYLVQLEELRYAADTKMVHYEGLDGVSARVRGTIIGVFQPLSFEAGNHFLWGNVVDPLTAFLACMAFMPGVRRRSTSLLQATVILVTCAVMTAGLSQYVYPSVTRTFLIVVPVAMLASLGFSAVANVGSQGIGRWPVAAAGLCLVLATCIAAFNWVKLWNHNPYQRRHDWHIVAMQEIENALPHSPVAVVFPHEDPRSYLLEKIITMTGYGDRALLFDDDRRGLEDLDQRLLAGQVWRVLSRTDRGNSEVLVTLCAEHGVPLRFIGREKVAPPLRSRLMEHALAIIDRFERRRPER